MLNYLSNPIPPHCITPVNNPHNITHQTPYNRPPSGDSYSYLYHTSFVSPPLEPTFSPTYTYSYPTLPYSDHELHRSLFNHAFNRIHEYAGGSFGPGVGMHEARHWHRRAYGGLVSAPDISQFLSLPHGFTGRNQPTAS